MLPFFLSLEPRPDWNLFLYMSAFKSLIDVMESDPLSQDDVSSFRTVLISKLLQILYGASRLHSS